MCVLLTCQCSSWLIVPEFHPGSATDPHCVHRLLWIHLGYVPLLFPPERRWNHDGSSGLDSWRRAQTRATEEEEGWMKLSEERILRCSYSSYLYSIHSFCFCFCSVRSKNTVTFGKSMEIICDQSKLAADPLFLFFEVAFLS